MLGILIDNGSSYDVMYTNVFINLGLHDRNLIPYESENLLAFNYSTTHPGRVVELSVSIKEGNDEKIVTVYFLVIPSRSVYNCILRRYFLVTLVVVASIIHLKMKYHNKFGESNFILTDLCRTRLIHQMILKNPRATVLIFDKKMKTTLPSSITTLNLDVRED